MSLHLHLECANCDWHGWLDENIVEEEKWISDALCPQCKEKRRKVNRKANWIKCNDNLPGNWDRVLICNVMYGSYPVEMIATFTHIDGKSHWQVNHPDDFTPTHWMPLPEPPILA